MSKQTIISIVSCFVALQLGNSMVHAADLVAPEPPVIEAAPVESPWSGNLAIYGFLPWMSGDAGVNGLGPVDFALTPSQIIDDLDFTIQASGEINYDRFGLFGDFIYFKISQGEATAVGPLIVDANLSVAMTSATVAGTYAFYEDDTTSLKVMAGARYWSLDTTLDLTVVPVGRISANEIIDWWDPVVGLRGRKQLTDKVYITGTGVIGGFGAGSKFMWDVFGGVGYDFNDHVAITAGYRGMGFDYSDQGDVVDIIAHGPLAGVAFKF